MIEVSEGKAAIILLCEIFNIVKPYTSRERISWKLDADNNLIISARDVFLDTQDIKVI